MVGCVINTRRRGDHSAVLGMRLGVRLPVLLGVLLWCWLKLLLVVTIVPAAT